MRILGSSALRTIELSDQLQFVNGYESGWIDFLAPPAALFILFVWAMIFHYYLMAWFIVIGYLLLVLWWLNGNVTRLSVTDTLLIARGGLSRSYQNERRVQTDELKSIVYFAGAGEHLPGLYANHGWQRTCLMPHLTQAEAESVIEAIYKKFPHLAYGQMAHMESIHAEANGEFHPHIQTLEVDPMEDLRQWKAQKVRELEIEEFHAYSKPHPPLATHDGAQDLESK